MTSEESPTWLSPPACHVIPLYCADTMVLKILQMNLFLQKNMMNGFMIVA